MMSTADEISLGQQYASEVPKEQPLVQDAEVNRYIESLGQKLAAHAPGAKYPYTFHVVNSNEINAFALPGGPVYVNVGTVQAADNEAQLAGVLAHEIAHVYMRHATHNASRQMAASIPLQILGGMLGQGMGGQLARLGLSFGVGSIFLKYSRDAESEADRVGAKIMYEAGYDPHAMAAFFENLKAEGGGSGGPQFLSDHPDPGNRAQAVNEAISQLPPKTFVKNSNDFTRAKAEAARMKPLTAQQIAQQQQQRQAQVTQASAADIMPSRDFRTLNHSQFQLAYPSNWQVFGDQNSAVTIAPRAGVSQDGIAYGVVVSGMRPQQAQSLEQSTQQIYEFLRQSNPQLQQSGQVQRTSLNGMEAMVVPMVGPSPLRDASGAAAPERDLLVTSQRSDGTVIFMLFIAPQAHWEQLSPAYQEMLRSFRTR